MTDTDGDRTGTRAATDAADASTGPRCPSCDAETYRRHCKYVCPAHGVVMDCADTFW